MLRDPQFCGAIHSKEKAMNGINEVYLLGRVGQPPEFKQLPSGNSVCTFNVATNSHHKQDDNEKKETEWSSVKLWARQAEIADQYVNRVISWPFLGGSRPSAGKIHKANQSRAHMCTHEGSP
jgi:hypothetical protein